jgi:hypothetical protein
MLKSQFTKQQKSYIATTNEYDTTLYDYATLEPIHEIAHNTRGYYLFISDTKFVYLANNNIFMYKIDENDLVSVTLKVKEARPCHLRFIGDTVVALIHKKDFYLVSWNVSTRRLITTKLPCYAADFMPLSTTEFLMQGEERNIFKWDNTTKQMTEFITTENSLNMFQKMSDDRIVTCTSGGLQAWDIESKTKLAELALPENILKLLTWTRNCIVFELYIKQTEFYIWDITKNTYEVIPHTTRPVNFCGLDCCDLKQDRLFFLNDKYQLSVVDLKSMTIAKTIEKELEDPKCAAW